MTVANPPASGNGEAEHGSTALDPPALPAVRPILRVRELLHELIPPQSAEPRRNTAGQATPAAPIDKYTVSIDEIEIPRGEFVAILGPSGCGKTTLLTILGLARKPFRLSQELPAVQEFSFYDYGTDPAGPAADDTDDAECGGQRIDLIDIWGRQGQRQGGSRSDVDATSNPSRRRGRINRHRQWTIEDLRRQFLGFALQSGELLTNLTVLENVEMPLRLNGRSAAEAERRVREVLTMLGTEPGSEDAAGQISPSDPVYDASRSKLWQRRFHLPSQLSGGEYQRVALARALAHHPRLLFLDEPTNNLDPKTAGRALQALAGIQKREGVTVLMITHDVKLAREYASFILRMDSPRAGLGTVAERQRKDEQGRWWATDARWRIPGAPPAPARVFVRPAMPSAGLSVRRERPAGLRRAFRYWSMMARRQWRQRGDE